jgi:DNA polymerase III subunit alpha
MADWVSCHTHTTFSPGDGYGLPEDHVARAAELGMTALALTEHGNCSSFVQLEQAAKKHGIKAIFGVEAYCGPPLAKFKNHLGLLAMDMTGYQNLMKIITQSWRDYYYFPTLYGKVLAEHQEGIAVLSGCTGSKLAVDLIGGKGQPDHAPDLKAAARTAARFRDIFGDRYYLETQGFPELDKTRAINPAYERISRELGIPLIATMDIHYPRPEDSDLQMVLHANGRGHNTAEMQMQSFEYDVPMSYCEDDQQLWTRLVDTGLSRQGAVEAISSAASLAERCNVTLPKAERLRYPGMEAELTWSENR